jgi:hypothetical protein
MQPPSCVLLAISSSSSGQIRESDSAPPKWFTLPLRTLIPDLGSYIEFIVSLSPHDYDIDSTVAWAARV